jgi:glycosyltransferase involved in cell wall biosynthesis
MLRIKNESQWIAEVLESILPLCSKIYILDDHSTDNTIQICHRYLPQVEVLPSPFTGLNEARDKNWLYDEIVRRCRPEYILCVDGDEVLERRGPGIIRDTVAKKPDVNSFVLKIAFMWGDRDAVRVDRIYSDFWRPSLFKPFHEIPGDNDTRTLLTEFRFMATPFGRKVGDHQPNLHCSSVPQRFIHGRQMCPVRLKHYGYIDRETRVRKLDFYTGCDWKNLAEDCYRHITQGDSVDLEELPRVKGLVEDSVLSLEDVAYITGVPKELSLVHAGPLVVKSWDEDEKWVPSQWAVEQYGKP